MSTTSTILSHVEKLGYVVKIFVREGSVELHAVKVPEGKPSHVARCIDGDGEEEAYRAAVLLARGIGLDVEDG